MAENNSAIEEMRIKFESIDNKLNEVIEKLDILMDAVVKKDEPRSLQARICSYGGNEQLIPINCNTTVRQLKSKIRGSQSYLSGEIWLEILKPDHRKGELLDDDDATVVSYGIERTLILFKTKPMPEGAPKNV